MNVRGRFAAMPPSRGAGRQGRGSPRRRWWRRGERGQALTETGLLLAVLLGGLAVGGLWLMKAHPDLLRAIDIQVRSRYFVLSLPVP